MRGDPTMSEQNIADLWVAARMVTPDVAEQTWLVVYTIKAGKTAEWLREVWGDADPQDLGVFGVPLLEVVQ